MKPARASDSWPNCVVSGGQTGVDRAALDVAIQCGIDHGGWCPQGRLAEDGPIPPRYELQETESTEYPVRTQRNVLDSDGTLILFRERLYGGTELTRHFAQQAGKPLMMVDLNGSSELESIHAWIRQYGIRRLNVAGPRESSAPGITAQSRQFLTRLLSQR